MLILCSNFYFILKNVAGVFGGKGHLKRKLETKTGCSIHVGAELIKVDNNMYKSCSIQAVSSKLIMQAQQEICDSFLKV